MTSTNMPGLDVSARVRARDIQLAGVADLRRRVVLVTGAIDTADHDLSVSLALPGPGRWQIIKAEANLTDRVWVAMQVTTDENSHFVNDADTMVQSRQFARSFMTPDQRRLTFYDGEVRPGEAVLKVFTIETGSTRPAYVHAQYSPVSTSEPGRPAPTLEQVIADGVPARPVLEVFVPVTVRG